MVAPPCAVRPRCQGQLRQPIFTGRCVSCRYRQSNDKSRCDRIVQIGYKYNIDSATRALSHHSPTVGASKSEYPCSQILHLGIFIGNLGYEGSRHGVPALSTPLRSLSALKLLPLDVIFEIITQLREPLPLK